MCKRNCFLFWWIIFLFACSPIEKTPIVENSDDRCFLYLDGKSKYPKHDPHYGEYSRGLPRYGYNDLFLERHKIKCQIQEMLQNTTTGKDL